MIADGERIKVLLESAQREVLLCAPFVKARVLRTILSVVPETVPVRIITRWRAAEVHAGVSDLEVFDIANERPNTKLALLDDLHAKLYIADDDGLVGSANLTGAALGWAERSNIEVLVPAKSTDAEIQRLLKQLDSAETATFTLRSQIETDAAALKDLVLEEGLDITDDKLTLRGLPWLPSCAAPERLFEIYQDANTTVVVEGTRVEGVADLRDLHIAGGMSSSEFADLVQETLLLMPGFNQIVEHIPKGLTDAKGSLLVQEMRPEMAKNDVITQWRIIRDWIGEFFPDRFEVAPETFITRLRPRQ